MCCSNSQVRCVFVHVATRVDDGTTRLLPGTQRLLKVPEGGAWTGICSGPAHEALMPDWPQDYLPLLGSLLDAGLRVLVYAGNRSRT